MLDKHNFISHVSAKLQTANKYRAPKLREYPEILWQKTTGRSALNNVINRSSTSQAKLRPTAVGQNQPFLAAATRLGAPRTICQ